MAKKVMRPRKVKIKEKEYKFIAKDNLHCYVKRKVRNKRKSQTKKQKLFGQISFDTVIIELEKQQGNEEMVDTIIHEIFHGIVREFDIKVDGRKEEKFVRDLSTGFKDVLKENPNLMSWIKKRLEELSETV